MASFYSCAYTEGIHVVRLNPYLRQNYSIFMRNFKQNQHKLSNNDIQFSNRNLLCKFEPPSKKSWIRPCLYHLFYFIYMGQPIWDPYGTRLHCPYGCPHGTHMGHIKIASWVWATHMGSATGFCMGPIWVSPYADCPDGSCMGPI